MNIKKILLLVDYRGKFYSSTKVVAGTMDIAKIKALFEKNGYIVTIKGFADVDFRSEKYRGVYVLYQSSEDPDLRYKDYIEDVLLGLELVGAILIPSFHKFRAHHNKVFMEILRDVSGYSLLQNITSKAFGTFEDLELHINTVPIPAVIKQAQGARSQSVSLARSMGEVMYFATRMSSTPSLINLKRWIAGIWSGRGYKPISNHRNKFLVQSFVGGLSGDYKVVVYTDRFYFFRRENRKGDFRASGSIDFTFPDVAPDGLLDYVEKVFVFFDVPFGSFDVAIKDGVYYLLEFQFVSFGQRALERSHVYFRKCDSRWESVVTTSDLEECFTASIVAYLNKHTTSTTQE
ncbi:MAG: hypothetical protein KBD24_04385 [Candidatus Pacebacteria bacterium]|nr:hypothetical protein [Candidatus Paceibacterota bacterium]